MKKTLLCLFALFLTATAVSAQKAAQHKSWAKVQGRSLTTAIAPQVFNSPQTRAGELGADERILGFYNTDDLDLSGAANIGFRGIAAGTYQYKVGATFLPALTQRYVGGKITKVRYGLSEDNGANKLFIYKVDLDSEAPIEPALVEVDVPETHAGWNEVTLPTPVTIEENTTYLIGYEYNQKIISQNMQLTQANFPVLCDYSVNINAETELGLMAYGNFEGTGAAWYRNSGAGLGNLCIQAYVEGGSFSDYDLTLSNLTTNSMYGQNGQEYAINFNITNTGNLVPQSYTINVAIDGTTVSTLNTPVQFTDHKPQASQNTITIPSDLDPREHTLSVYVVDINGVAPTTDINDDMVTGTVNTYYNNFGHQMSLIEEFTSTACSNCPMGHGVMEAIGNLRNDVAIVGVHGNIPGESIFMTDKSLDLFNNLLISKRAPAASFNRYYLDDLSMNQRNEIAFDMGFDQSLWDAYAQIFSAIIDMSNDMPAFATVDIATNYDPATRKLDVTVSGKVSPEDLAYYLEDAALTVYLTEDNIVGYQNNMGVADNNYVHNHVLRDVLTETLGSPLEITDGDKYSMTYSTTLDEGWNADNMNVIAFVSRQVFATSDVRDVYVNQTNQVKVGGTVGINNVGVTEGNVKEVARYSLDGRQLSRPEKGINIIKMSDGSTRKVIVKQ